MQKAIENKLKWLFCVVWKTNNIFANVLLKKGLKHTVKIELRGDCYQQRIFDLSSKSIAQKCRGYIFRGDLEDMIAAVSNGEFGEYI